MPISTNLVTKHPWAKGSQFCSNEGPCRFPRGDNYEISENALTKFKIVFSRTAGPISTKLSTKYLLVKGIQVCTSEGPHPFPMGDNYKIAKIY